MLVRYIHIEGNITDPLADEVVHILNDITPRTAVVFRINSEGGNLGAFQRIALEIHARPNSFTAYVDGACHSAAFMLLQFCSRIGSSITSSFMIHYPRLFKEDVTRDTGFPAEDDIILYDDQIYKEFLERFSKQRNIPIKFLEELSLQEKVFTAPQAEEFGVLDYIL